MASRPESPRPRSRVRSRNSRLEARYANYFEIGHNRFEFIIDFGQYHPESESALMHSRMVTGPVYAKLLADLLRGAVQRFEEEHGMIQPADDELDPLEMVKQSIDGFDRRLDRENKRTRGTTKRV